MRKHLFVLIIMILPAGVLMAQVEIKGVETTSDAPKRNLNDPLFVIRGNHKVLEYVSDTKEDSKLFFNVIKPEWIDSVSVIKPEQAIAKFGERARFGAVIFSLHEGSVFKLPDEWQDRFTESKP